MSTAIIQGELWEQASQAWASLQELKPKPLWEAMLERGSGMCQAY